MHQGIYTGTLLFSLCSILGLGNIQAQSPFDISAQFKFEKYETDLGLESSTPTDFIQDRDGYLWVCSADGLYKFDSYRFRKYRHAFSQPNSISKNHVRTAFQDSKGRIWLSIWEHGINLLYPDRDSIDRFDKQSSNPLGIPTIVNAIAEDPDGRIWIGSATHLCILEEVSSGIFRQIDPVDYLPGIDTVFLSGEISSFLLDAQNRFWVGHISGIGYCDWNNQTWQSPPKEGLPAAEVHDIETDRSGTVWITTDTHEGARMWKFDESRYAFVPFQAFPYQSNHRWIHFCFDLDNRLWAAEFGYRLQVLDIRKEEVVLNLNDNPQPGYEVEEMFLRNPFCDATGNVWFGGHWLYKQPYQRGFRHFQHPFNFKKLVSSILVDKDHIWLGTINSGIVRVDRQNGKAVFAPLEDESNPSRNAVYSFLELPDERLLIIGFSTVKVMNKRTFAIEADFPAFRSPMRSGFRDSKGRIWVGSYYGLHQLDIDNETPDTVLVETVKAIVEDRNGNLWLGGRNLTRYNPETGETRYITKIAIGQDSLPISFNTDLAYRDDTLWIGTSEGLIAYDLIRQKGMYYHEDHGLPNAYIFGIRFDRNGGLWVSASNTIARLDRTTGKFTCFNETDGLINTMYYYQAHAVDNAGNLYFGGQDGLDFFHPDSIRQYPVASSIAITDFTTVGEKAILKQNPEEVVLHHNNVFTEITVSAMNMGRPGSVRYAYTIEGLMDTWISLGADRVLKLPHLPLGKYTVHVTARHADGSEASAPLAIPVTVMPAFYETLVFRLGAIFLLIGLVIGGIWYMSRRRREKSYQKTLRYFAHSHYGESSVDEVLWDVARNVISRLEFEDCVVYLLDPDSNHLQQKAAYGPKNPRGVEIDNPISIPVGKGIVGHVAQTGIGEIIPDTRKDPRYIVDDKERRSEIAVPILYKGKTIGVIDAENSQPRYFTQRHLEVLTEIASYCAEKVVKAQAQTEARKRAGQLQEMQTQIARIEKRALLAQMNPHFIFNAMNSIQHFITENDQESALRYLNKFSRLIREVLNIASEDRITLARELQFLVDYIHLEQLRFQNRFRFAMDIDESIEPSLVEIPAFILQPHVENAILHGFSEKVFNPLIRVQITKTVDNNIRIDVTDNGIGRERSRKKRLGNHKMKYESKGLQLMQERFRILASQDASYSLQVIDLVDPSGEPAGTRVSITIPLES